MSALDAAMPDPVAEPTMTAARVAPILQMSVRGVYAAAERGEIPSIKVGRAVRFPTRLFLRRFFPTELPTESDPMSNSDAVTSADTRDSHANLTTGNGRRRGLTALPDPPTEAA